MRVPSHSSGQHHARCLRPLQANTAGQMPRLQSPLVRRNSTSCGHPLRDLRGARQISTLFSPCRRMKRAQFCKPGSLIIEYQEHREGPSPVFVCWKPSIAQSFTDRSALLKFCAWPASTPTGRELRDWIDLQLSNAPAEGQLDMGKIKETGWGPEAHAEAEPNDQTKTII